MFQGVGWVWGCGHPHMSKLEPFNPTIKGGPIQDSGASLVPRRGNPRILPITLCFITELGLIQLSWNQVLCESQVLWWLISWPWTWVSQKSAAESTLIHVFQHIPKSSSWLPTLPNHFRIDFVNILILKPPETIPCLDSTTEQNLGSRTISRFRTNTYLSPATGIWFFHILGFSLNLWSCPSHTWSPSLLLSPASQTEKPDSGMGESIPKAKEYYNP